MTIGAGALAGSGNIFSGMIQTSAATSTKGMNELGSARQNIQPLIGPGNAVSSFASAMNITQSIDPGSLSPVKIADIGNLGLPGSNSNLPSLFGGKKGTAR